MIPAALLKKYGPYAAIALVAIGILSLTYCEGKKSGKTGEVIQQQEREIETQEKLGEANVGAADRRVEDAKKAVEQEKELIDALKTTQDPARQRVLRGCIILRQQGRDTSSISACR
jgi:hypothetical protein